MFILGPLPILRRQFFWQLRTRGSQKHSVVVWVKDMVEDLINSVILIMIDMAVLAITFVLRHGPCEPPFSILQPMGIPNLWKVLIPIPACHGLLILYPVQLVANAQEIRSFLFLATLEGFERNRGGQRTFRVGVDVRYGVLFHS